MISEDNFNPFVKYKKEWETTSSPEKNYPDEQRDAVLV